MRKPPKPARFRGLWIGSGGPIRPIAYGIRPGARQDAASWLEIWHEWGFAAFVSLVNARMDRSVGEQLGLEEGLQLRSRDLRRLAAAVCGDVVRATKRGRDPTGDAERLALVMMVVAVLAAPVRVMVVIVLRFVPISAVVMLVLGSVAVRSVMVVVLGGVPIGPVMVLVIVLVVARGGAAAEHQDAAERSARQSGMNRGKCHGEPSLSLSARNGSSDLKARPADDP